MKQTLLSIFSLFHFLCSLTGQINLVPNGSFESYSTCPNGLDQINLAYPWVDPTTSGTDFFDSCSSGVGVPSNPAGYQFAMEGWGYAGFNAYVSSFQYRTYLQVKLDSPLIAGQAYCLSFYVSLADTCNYATDAIGACLSQNSLTCSPAGCLLNYTPQIQNTQGNILGDTLNWILISGVYNAAGGEEYLTIGNFKADTVTTYVAVNSIPNQFHSYYYVDLVSLVELAPAIALVGANVEICPGDSAQLGASGYSDITYSWQPTEGLSDSTIANPLSSPTVTTTYTLSQTQCDVTSTATVTITVRTDCDLPSPFFIPSLIKGDEMLTISGLEPNSKLEIFDALGRRVFYSENYQNDFGGFKVAAATYIVRFTKPNGEVVKQKLVIVK